MMIISNKMLNQNNRTSVFITWNLKSGLKRRSPFWRDNWSATQSEEREERRRRRLEKRTLRRTRLCLVPLFGPMSRRRGMRCRSSRTDWGERKFAKDTAGTWINPDFWEQTNCLNISSRAAELPEKALKAAAREFKRLKKMSPQVRTLSPPDILRISLTLSSPDARVPNAEALPWTSHRAALEQGDFMLRSNITSLPSQARRRSTSNEHGRISTPTTMRLTRWRGGCSSSWRWGSSTW